MKDPFQLLPDSARWPLFLVLSIATMAYSWALGRQGKELKNPVAPCGIVSYELAWAPARSDAIRTSWEVPPKLDTAHQQIHWDFGFLLLYPLPFSLLCAQVARRSRRTGASTGFTLSRAVLMAAPLDFVEDLILLHLLDHGATGIVAVASLAATFKFALLLVALGYVVIQGGRVLWQRVRD